MKDSVNFPYVEIIISQTEKENIFFFPRIYKTA